MTLQVLVFALRHRIWVGSPRALGASKANSGRGKTSCTPSCNSQPTANGLAQKQVVQEHLAKLTHFVCGLLLVSNSCLAFSRFSASRPYARMRRRGALWLWLCGNSVDRGSRFRGLVREFGRGKRESKGKGRKRKGEKTKGRENQRIRIEIRRGV